MWTPMGKAAQMSRLLAARATFEPEIASILHSVWMSDPPATLGPLPGRSHIHIPYCYLKRSNRGEEA